MNKKIINGFTNGLKQTFNPANQNTEPFKAALYQLISIFNSEKLLKICQDLRPCIYIADGVNESMGLFKELVKFNYNSPKEFIMDTTIVANEDFDTYNLAIFDTESMQVYFFGTSELANHLTVGNTVENLLELIFEDIMIESGMTYFVKDCDAQRDFLDILQRTYNEYCLKENPKGYSHYKSSDWSYIQALKNYLSALDEYYFRHW